MILYIQFKWWIWYKKTVLLGSWKHRRYIQTEFNLRTWVYTEIFVSFIEKKNNTGLFSKYANSYSYAF